MDEAIVDEWYRWIGVAIVSLAILGLVMDLPDERGQPTTDVATTVEAVAASEYPATGEHPLTADAVRLRPGSVSLRTGGDVRTATLAYRVTPTGSGSRLAGVLRGRPPTAGFSSPRSFARAADRARAHSPGWQQTGDSLLVRHVTWEDVDVTLVGT